MIGVWTSPPPNADRSSPSWIFILLVSVLRLLQAALHLRSLLTNHEGHEQKLGRPRQLLRTRTGASMIQDLEDDDVLRSPDVDND